ncbi:MAG: efflux RND transporter periplasmic adaptor subunit [Hyphomicrobiaceae bacterium]|nr:efflux RND transporter periplasmic adaptor subunit [Hyphomicrobiaceae bacterium]
MTSRLKKYLFTLAVPLAALAIASLWLPNVMGGGKAGLSYDTAEVTRGTIRKIVSTSGPVRAMVTVQVGSQLSGQIRTVSADYNTEVKEGDVLAELDSKTFKAKVAQAQADLAAAKAQLANQEAAVVKSEAMLRQAERTIERQQKLADRGFSAQAALDTATRDTEVARAELIIARAQVDNAKAVIAQRQAQLQQAQIDLDRTIIRSPINGTVISRTVDVGQTVAASLQAPELFQIAQDLRRIRIEAQVNEADVGVIAEGNAASFTVDAYPDRKFEGRVTQVRLAATELQNVVTYTVIVEASNEDRRLYPGMTANLQIVTAEKNDVLRLSNDALRFRPRNRPAASVDAASAGRRGAAMAGQLKVELNLTDEQAARLAEEMKRMSEARANRPAPPSGFGGPQRAGAGQGGGQFMKRIEQIVQPMLTDEQRPLFERWKQNRDSARTATVWALGPAGELEQRHASLGIADDQFTEILSGNIAVSDQLVTRAREVGQ